MVDLSLASSYVPAFATVAKSVALALASTIVLPIGGAPLMGLLLLLDRQLLNDESILDVNAVVCFLEALVISNHGRLLAYETQFSLAVCAVWACLVLLQSMRPTLGTNVELVALASLGAALCFTGFPAQPLSILLLRVVAFDLAVLIPSYLEHHPTPLLMLRMAPAMVAPPVVAALFCLALASVWLWRHRGRGQQPGPADDAEAQLVREALARHKAAHAQ